MSDTQKPLTGRNVLIIAVSAFGVIIAANLAMLFAATSTFPGLVVKNSYVASQEFNTRKAAQSALGWSSNASLIDGRLSLQLIGTNGKIAHPAMLSATIGRPTTDRDDQVVALMPNDHGWSAELPLGPGIWRLEIDAVAENGTAFSQKILIEAQEAQ